MNNVFLNIGKIFSKNKAYRSIKKMPISVWWSITEGDNFQNIVISGAFSNIKLYNIYLDLLQQYYDAFGTTEQHKAFLDARLNYALKLAQYLSTQDSFDKMFMEMALIDLQDVSPKQDQTQKEIKLSEAITIIEKNFGFQLDEETLSVYKFYSYQKALTNG
jgi:hypothetical protein